MQTITVVTIKSSPRNSSRFNYIPNFAGGAKLSRFELIGKMRHSRDEVRKKERKKREGGGNETRREKGAKFETSNGGDGSREYPAECRFPRRFANYQCNTPATSNYVVPLNGKPLTRDKSHPRRLRNHANFADVIALNLFFPFFLFPDYIPLDDRILII